MHCSSLLEKIAHIKKDEIKNAVVSAFTQIFIPKLQNWDTFIEYALEELQQMCRVTANRYTESQKRLSICVIVFTFC